MPDKIKEAFSAVKNTGLFLDEKDFRDQLSKSPKDVFSAIGNTGLFVDYDDFETSLDLKKKGSTSSTTGSPSVGTDFAVGSQSPSQSLSASQSVESVPSEGIFDLLIKKNSALQKKKDASIASMPIAPGAVPMPIDTKQVDSELSDIDNNIKSKAGVLGFQVEDVDSFFKDISSLKSTSLSDEDVRNLFSLKNDKPQSYARSIASLNWTDAVRSSINSKENKDELNTEFNALTDYLKRGSYGEGSYAQHLDKANKALDAIYRMTVGDADARKKAIANFKKDFLPSLGRAAISDPSVVKSVSGGDYASKITADVQAIFDKPMADQNLVLDQAEFTSQLANEAKQRRGADRENEGLSVISSGITDYLEGNLEKIKSANDFVKQNKERLDVLVNELKDYKGPDKEKVDKLEALNKSYKSELDALNALKPSVTKDGASNTDIAIYNRKVEDLNSVVNQIKGLAAEVNNPEIQSKIKEYNSIVDVIKKNSSIYSGQDAMSKWMQWIENKKNTQFQRFPVKALDQALEDMQNYSGSNTNFAEKMVIGLSDFAKSTGDLVDIVYENLFYTPEQRLQADFERIGRDDYANLIANYQTQSQSLKKNPYITVFSDEVKAQLDAIKNSSESDEEKYKKTYKLIVDGRKNGSIYDTTNPNAGEYNITAKSVLNTISRVLPQLVAQYGFAFATGGGGAASALKSTAGLVTSTFLQGYSQYHSEAVRQGIANPDQYALGHSLIDALTEGLNIKDFEVLKKVGSGLKGAAGKFMSELTESQWKSLRKGSLNTFKDLPAAIKSNVGANFQEALVEEPLAQLGGNILDNSVFNKNSDIFEGVVDVALETSIGMLPMTALGIPLSYRKANIANKYQFYVAGQNPSDAIEAIQNQLKDNEITQAQADERIDLVNSMAKVVKSMPKTYADGRPMKDSDKAEYAFNQFIIERSKVNTDSVPTAQKEQIKKTAEEADAANSKILEGPKLSKTETPPAGKRLFNDPNPQATELEIAYKQSKGINTPEPAPITKLDENRSKAIADAYEAMQDNPNDPEVQKAYEAMANETLDQFKIMADAGIQIELWEGEGEPYKNSAEMIADVRDNKHMYVFSTEQGFGETKITDEQRAQNALLRDSGFKDKNGKTLLINDVFRGVHDFFGHTKLGNSFGAIGEENAWNVHARMYSPLARRAMTTETRGQNSWVNFNKAMRNPDGSIKKKGDEGFIPVEQRPFADQKMGLLPEEFSQIEDSYSTKEVPQKTEIDLAIEAAIPVIEQSYKKAGLKAVVVEDQEEFAKITGEMNPVVEGIFSGDDGTIYINKQALSDAKTAGRVVWHEASHPLMNIIRNSDKALYDKMVSGVKDLSGKNKVIESIYNWINKSYKDKDSQGRSIPNIQETREDELVVETLAAILNGDLKLSDLNAGFVQTVIDFVNKLAEKLGFDWRLNNTDIKVFKEKAAQVVDVLKSGRDISEIVGEENATKIQNTIGLDNVLDYAAPFTETTQLRVGDKYGPKVKHSGSHKLSFVKPSDIIDIKSLVADIEKKGQKVWFWTADQLGRGMYFDKVMDGEHYLDAGPSFALDPENRSKGVIWATGKGQKWIEDKVNSSDYIFIISGSPLKSKMFNKRVAEITFNRIKKALGEDGAWDKFKSEILSTSKIGAINKIVEKYNSFEELIDSPDRKELLIQFDAQKGKKGTPLKGLLEKYGAFVDYNELRDGFYKDNDFQLNDVMLVLKPTGFGGKSAHSTYENDVLGEVIGVPDRRVNAFDIMPEEFRDKYSKDISKTEQSQAVAPYGVGVREVQASKGGRNIIPETKQKKLTDDGKGNYVFFHYSGKKLNKIDPAKFGSNLATGRDERPGVGISMFYVDNKTSEPGVPTDFGYAVRVPKEKVYPINEDPLNFYDEAKAQFEADYPGQAFDANKQVGYITKVANENGFDMTVVDWNIKGKKALRAQTTEAVKPEVYKKKEFRDGFEREIFTPELEKLKPGIQKSEGNRNLAPNGKPSNLNDKQYEQVRTPEFKNWFGDWENDPENSSKVVDENGEPLVVYHGTTNSFDKFKTDGLAFFFSDDPDVASTYSQKMARGSEPNVIPVFLNIKRLQSIDAKGEKFGSIPVTFNAINITNRGLEYKTGTLSTDDIIKTARGIRFPELLSEVKKPNGVVIKNVKDGLLGGIKTSNVYAAFNENQIKSAIGNEGSFSTEDDRIQKSAGQRTAADFGESADPKTRITLADLGVSSDMSARELIDNLIKFNGSFNPLLKSIAKKKNLDDLKIGSLTEITDDPSEAAGGFLSKFTEGVEDRFKGKLYINDQSDNYDFSTKNQYYTLTHELMHWVTLDSLNTPVDTPAYKNLREIYDVLSKNADTSPGFGTFETYGLSNFNEFMAELFISARFRDYVKDVMGSSKDLNGQKDLVTILVDYLKDLFARVFKTDGGTIDPNRPLIDQATEVAKEMFFGNNMQRSAGNRNLAPNGKPSNLNAKQWEQVRTPEFKKWFGDWENDPENASKVVDENGEPLVVYHGARKSGFDVFDNTIGDRTTGAPDGSSFFARDIATARSYSGTSREVEEFGLDELDERGGIYSVFLNIRSDYAINFDGANWDGLMHGKYEVLNNDTGESEIFDDRAEAIEYAEANGMSWIDVRKDPYIGYTTDRFTREAQSAGVDGAMIYNVIDNGRYSEAGPTDIYVVFNPNQIKSATANSGLFSLEDNRIQASPGGRTDADFGRFGPEYSKEFKTAAYVMRAKADGMNDAEIATGLLSVNPGMTPQEAKDIIDNPEAYIRSKFSYLTPALQENLINRARVKNIYAKSRTTPDAAFDNLEVRESSLDEAEITKKGALKKWLGDFKRQWLDAAKGLPEWVLAIKDISSGVKDLQIRKATDLVKDLKKTAESIGFNDWDAFSKAMRSMKRDPETTSMEAGIQPWFANIPGKQLENAPATIPAEIAALPEEIIPFVYSMRGMIDNLSSELVASGFVTPSQALTLTENLGEYVNRAYRLFNEKGYKPSKESIRDARKFLADKYIKQLATESAGMLTFDQIEKKAIDMANKDIEAIISKKLNPYFKKNDSRDTGILKERKDIPAPIRKLMGEYTDPGTAFIITVAKQASLKAASQYLTALRNNGLGKIFFEENDPERPLEFSVKIASDGSESKSPLNGLMTTPEIAEAIESVGPTFNDLTNTWMKLVGAVRWGKTVGSVVTQFKNFESNLGFAVMNGLIFSGNNTEAFKGAGKYFSGQVTGKKLDELTEKVMALGLVNQSVGTGELRKMLGSGDIHDIAVELAVTGKAKGAMNWIGKPFRAANKLYQLSDDFWKVYGYLNERELIANALYNNKYESLSVEEQAAVDIEASERVKMTQPTYDRVWAGAKYVSERAPIFGNFISFQAEVVRVLGNTVKIAAQDMKSDNPKVKALGYKRLAGMMTYVALRTALTYAAAQAAGIGAAGLVGMFDDDEEKEREAGMRKALPQFMRTGDLMVRPTGEPGKFVAFELSSIDPYGIVFKSMNALTEGREGVFSETMDPGVPAAMAEFFSGFLEQEMTFKTFNDLMNNSNPRTGEKIIKSDQTKTQAFLEAGKYVANQLKPSTIGLMERLAGDNPAAEFGSMFGARPYEVDLNRSFGRIMAQTGKDMEDVVKEYGRARFDKELTPEERKEKVRAAEERLAYYAKNLSETYRQFLLLGADKSELDKMIKTRGQVKSTGFNKAFKRSILTGEIKPETYFK